MGCLQPVDHTIKCAALCTESIMTKATKLIATIIVAFAISASAASASESKGEGSGPKYAKLDTITVNLQGLVQFLQTSITLKVASTEVEEAIKLHMPMVRHELILLLSSRQPGQISSLEGKQKLISETRSAVNKTIRMAEKQGVLDVLFESFVIQ